MSIPPHTQATLTFDLHNRHTYSEEEIRAGRGFAKYTAVIGVLSMTGDLLGRGAVQTEFRAVKDLYDRITGGAGPGGTKAVAPLGREQVSITIPPGVDQVSLLGEVLEATTAGGPRGRDAGQARRDRQQRAGHVSSRAAAAGSGRWLGLRARDRALAAGNSGRQATHADPLSPDPEPRTRPTAAFTL